MTREAINAFFALVRAAFFLAIAIGAFVSILGK